MLNQGFKLKTYHEEQPWTKSTNYMRKRKEIFDKLGIKKDLTLDPFFKFLGY